MKKIFLLFLVLPVIASSMDLDDELFNIDLDTKLLFDLPEEENDEDTDPKKNNLISNSENITSTTTTSTRNNEPTDELPSQDDITSTHNATPQQLGHFAQPKNVIQKHKTAKSKPKRSSSRNNTTSDQGKGNNSSNPFRVRRNPRRNPTTNKKILLR